jgi:molybdopterin-containing oxidoreductase family iron-sulfur binding subunit
MILPLFGGLSELDLLNDMLGNPPVPGPELVQETFRSTNPPGDFATAWSTFLKNGFAAHVTPKEKPPALNANASGGVAHNLWNIPPEPKPDSPEIVLVRDYSVDDGRYANNSWLQEMPDPITKLTWDNTAMMSPGYARRLGVKNGDLINIAVTESLLDKNQKPIRRELVIAALIMPGHAENSITIPLGYGRRIGTISGSISSSGGKGEHEAASMETPDDPHGFNAYLLRTSSNPHFIVADGKAVKAVQVTTALAPAARSSPSATVAASVSARPAGSAAPVAAHTLGSYPLSITQDHWSIEGRGLVREATIEGYRADEKFVEKIAGDEELPPRLPTIYTHPPLDAPQQWGLAVDLNVCTGCSACVIACQAENNVPVVGKLQVSHGRAMHWLRIDRYYASERPYDEDRGEYPEEPEIVHEPMMCQHCENAPCETVCPVNATVHSEDGLNVMAYNRCIGTRYCANNCPFKVRRFNFFDYNQRPIGKKKVAGSFGIYQEYIAPFTEKGAPDTIKMRNNPNVTVRMRGVMEKCTFCVQRIEEAKIAAHARAGASPNVLIPRDSFTTACAQACPNDAIAFGDIKDPESKVSRIKAQDRNYRLLEYLNVNTRTSYLARIRNPNPKMPDAKRIAVASLGAEGKGNDEKGQHDFRQHDKGVLNPNEQPRGDDAPTHPAGGRKPDQKP